MIDKEALLLAQYTNDEGLRKLISNGLKDENVEPFGEDALKVWQFAKAWFQRTSKAVPEKVLIEEFEKYIRPIREQGDPDVEDVDVKWLVQSIQRDYLQEQFRGRIGAAQSDGTFSKDLDFEESRKRAHEVASDLLKIAVNSTSDQPLTSVSDLLPSFLDDVFHYHEKIEEGLMAAPVTFGFDMVNDKYLGLAPGEMMVMLAYTGMGKSFMMCKFALAAVIQGKRVALWTLENSVEETLTRIATLAAHLPYDHVSNKVLAPVERTKLQDLIGEEAMSRLYVKQPMSREGATLEEIYWESQNLDIDLIVGDQLSHVYHPSERKSDPDWLIETNKLRYARNLSRETNMASIWAAQANAKAQGKAKLDLSMMARSQGYNQGADFVFGVTDPTKGAGNLRRLECIKARRGPSLAWEMVINWAPMDIEVVSLTT